MSIRVYGLSAESSATLAALLLMASSCEVGSKSITITSMKSSALSPLPISSPSPTPTPCAGGPYSVTVSWTANREKAVNSSGGGYTVYYSTTSPVNISTASSVNVPYVSGATAPTSKAISGLNCGTWYFKVVAYSALKPTGSATGAKSAESTQVAVTVP